MPIYVVCPNRCRFRMPIKWMGKSVQCPECDASIRVPVISDKRLKSGLQVVCKAEFIRTDSSSIEMPEKSEEPTSTKVTSEKPRASSTAPEQSIEEIRPAESSERLPVLEISMLPKSKTPDRQPLVDFQFGIRSEPKAKFPRTNSSRTISPKTDVRESFRRLEAETEVPVERSWQERLEQANSDRRVLARFLALCLVFVAIVNIGPAIYHWYYWTQLAESVPLPRWIYSLIFVGAIHLVYAIFLAQIPDWSALRAVSIAMLVIAFAFGVVSAGLLIGGQGSLTAFLGVPYSLNRQATIWCVAMLCLSTLMSYWSGKEASNWHRAEELLKNILSNSTA